MHEISAVTSANQQEIQKPRHRTLTLYCGEPSFQGKPYCLCHCALAYESLATRRRRAVEWAAAHPDNPSAERARRWNAYLGQGADKARQHERADAA